MIAALTSFLRRLAISADDLDDRRDDAYLSEAVDVYDLERRMRDLDGRHRTGHNLYMGTTWGTGG